MKRLAIFAVPLCAVVVGCGGSSTGTSSPPPSQPTKYVNGHPCSRADEALQCVLPPAPQGLRLQSSPFTIQGIDAAWGAPSASEARNRYHAKFLAGYLSYDASKNWTRARADEYHRTGLGTVAVWETSANRAGEGCGAGRHDAEVTRGQAAAVGNTTSPLDFAVDFDAEGWQVAGYFRCAQFILGSRVNAYGSYYVVMWLHAHGLVGNQNWCTYAWSRGNVCPASVGPLQQYLNDGFVDYDRAIAPLYGQWPQPVAKPASRKFLKTRIRVLHRELAVKGCNRRTREHKPTGPTCKRWKHEGDQRHRELGR